MRAKSIVRACQEAAVARLKKLAAFEGVPVLSRLTADLLNEIERAVAELGICVLVLPPVPAGGFPKAVLPTFGRMDWTIRIFENPLLNTLEVDAYSGAEIVLATLHGWCPGVAGIGKLAIAASPITDNSMEAIVFDCQFTSSGTFYMRYENQTKEEP